MTTEESGQESSPQPKPTKPYPGVAAMHRSPPGEAFQYARPFREELAAAVSGKVAPAAALVAAMNLRHRLLP